MIDLVQTARFPFVVGLVSLFSPCVFPLVPGYVLHVSGVSIDGLKKPDLAQRGLILLSSALFVLGYTLAFANRGSLL